MQLGTHYLPEPVVFLAPMAGVSDRPFRMLARRLGASAAVSEMVTSNTHLWSSDKSRQRLEHRSEPRPRIAQLLGNEPGALAEAARENVRRGADVIDLNLGCPAKKVYSKAAGSALMGEPGRVRELLEALTSAVEVPITLKMRLGLDRERMNGEAIAVIAEASGISMLSVHGRTRVDGYKGGVDYPAIRRITQAVSIPVLANGDITSPERALQVLDITGAAGVMIGRAAQGRPWLPGQVRAALAGVPVPSDPDPASRLALIEEHIAALHTQYGERQGVRIARKHIGWYLQDMGFDEARTRAARTELLAASSASEQLRHLRANLTATPSEAA